MILVREQGANRGLAAGKPPVRFDGREVETERGMRLFSHGRRNPDPEYVEACPAALSLDSTLNSLPLSNIPFSPSTP
jgi:hypothetical protein